LTAKIDEVLKMVRRKKTEDAPRIILLEVPADSDLPLKITKISDQTGLSPLDLFQKWVLQEESLIGLIQRSKTQATEQAETRPVIAPQEVADLTKQEKTAEINSDGSNYRKTLVKRAKKLKKEGMTLVKIAEIFNEDNVPTVSGTGKWYSSSISNLLSSKM
jgi:hypothetical protein